MNGKIERRRDQGAPARRESQQGFWSPFQQLNRLRNEIERAITSPFENLMTPADTSLFEGWAPSVDLYEDKDQFVVRAELPGMKKEEIDVLADENTLTISGEKRREEEAKDERGTYRAERFFGRFQRNVTLPAPIDTGNIHAQYKDGVLSLTVPKAEKARRKQIEVKIS